MDKTNDTKLIQSNSVLKQEIILDITALLKQCILSRKNDNAEHSKTIAFYCNATNGYLDIYFCDPELLEPVGDSGYRLELPELFDKSNKHKDGSIYFDDTMLSSSKSFGTSNLAKEIKIDFKLFFVDELNDIEEL
ncbi:hypothetical protein [uncultured Psychroserpens sp.]|uniref:hypothetical protein n=1 Tax=uncultured Psychroserpens sp. TaxID=255436 RepID=UPI0026383E82|nr:hypothetical protein [uncultured Psychroserpens sp.]